MITVFRGSAPGGPGNVRFRPVLPIFFDIKAKMEDFCEKSRSELPKPTFLRKNDFNVKRVFLGVDFGSAKIVYFEKRNTYCWAREKMRISGFCEKPGEKGEIQGSQNWVNLGHAQNGTFKPLKPKWREKAKKKRSKKCPKVKKTIKVQKVITFAAQK